MPKMTGGQAIVRSLLDHGVTTVFGIPGIQLDNLYDAFYERRNSLHVIHTRHEQGAAFMAMGYAQASGETGVFAVVPGPGLLNSLTALATAASANLPVLGLTGQIPSYQIGQNYGMAHELKDQLAVSRGIVITHPLLRRAAISESLGV
jgi:acetolactate synthase-1/2/3 large subunit